MKIWILHNTTYGNGKKVAETLGDVLGKKNDVKIEHIKNVSPEEVVKDAPDAIIVGAFIRAFMLSGASKRWVRNLKSSLKKSNKAIKYGATFLTHAMPDNMASGWGKRFNKTLQRGNVITNVYPEWLSGRVAKPEGPLSEGVLETITAKGADLIEWMK
ncbi:MAG TPA: flavodoxin domain-containing protein [Candidatus Bathyarchaeia archaeon]|nr:flavodoxin domain-containing protein [Candidatus Bathyarchaeia archaeon]